MRWSRVCVLPGDALVARSGDAVIVVDIEDTDQDDVRRSLLGVVRELAGAIGSPRRGLVTRRLVATIVNVAPEAVPAFAVAARSADGTELLLVGDMAAQWSDADGDHRVSGRDGPNWVDHFVAGDVGKLFVGREGATGEGHPLADLRDGAVMGDGAVVEVDGAVASGAGGSSSADETAEVAPADETAEAAPADETAEVAPAAAPAPAPASAPASAPAPAPAPAPAEDASPAVPPPPAAAVADDEPPAPEASIHTGGGPVVPAAPRREEPPAPSPASFVSLHFGEDDDDEDLGAREPLPLATDDGATGPEPAPDVATGLALVPGVHCAVGHFNHPESRYCVVCGRGFDQGLSRIVTQGPRPPLGVLVIDDGSAYVLDTDYVVGREPELDPGVSAGSARALPLSDANRTVSRLHADLRLDGWDAIVVDRGSTNGTYVLLPGAAQWSRVPPSGRAVVPPGARVAVGQRTFIYESHHVGAR